MKFHSGSVFKEDLSRWVYGRVIFQWGKEIKQSQHGWSIYSILGLTSSAAKFKHEMLKYGDHTVYRPNQDTLGCLGYGKKMVRSLGKTYILLCWMPCQEIWALASNLWKDTENY